MSILRFGPGSGRPQYGTGVFLSKVTRAGLVVSAWPRHRLRNLGTYMRSILDRMRNVTRTVKYVTTLETQAMRDALTEFNRSHTGLAGSATIRFEDLETERLFGRLWGFLLPGGRISLHVDAIQDISRTLDWLEPQCGSMFVRGQTQWASTDQAPVGGVFTMTPTGAVPYCGRPAQLWPPSEVCES